jgi:polysaccharide biosynthesis/export protein
MLQGLRLRRFVLPACLSVCLTTAGCNSMINGWLDPTELGSYTNRYTNEIRGSLSIQDPARGISSATEPVMQDLEPTVERYRLRPGDVVNVFIYELRGPGLESAQQGTLDNRGMINLPVVGWVHAEGYTARELEEALRKVLEDREILFDAEIQVQIVAQRGLTYTIFGNENLAIRLNRGPGVFPIPRADFRLLDALAISGGLSELVRQVYVFRKVARDRGQAEAVRTLHTQSDEPQPTARDEPETEPVVPPPPPPLPSVTMSDGFAPPSDHAAFTSASPFQDPPDGAASEQEQETPDSGKPDEKDTEEVPADVQELIDLMLPDSESTPDSAPDDTVAPPPSHQEETRAPQESGAPVKWVFLNGEWIEVSPEKPRTNQDASQELAQEEVVKPAIDWGTIASNEQDVRIIRIPARSVRRGDPRYNIVVRAGDVIRLYSGDIGFYYMTGNIRGPGVFVFRSGSQVTLKHAVAAAGGLSALAWPDRVTVYRRVGEREQMIQVNLDRIYAGVDPDFYLKRDDIVNIGTHPVAPFLAQIRNFTIPQMGGSVTYFYRFLRQETFFRNENLDAPNTPGLFP